ncbi:MAG: hypothetical protein JNK27_13280 [Chitinophagaceae bacterium]|nr:hypothetical protein [Chitinophagaceae bacterium]
MTKKKLSVSVLAIGLLFSAFKMVDDIITRLGMQQENAQWHIIRNFIGRFDTGPMEPGVEDGPANSVYKQLQSFRIPTAKLLPSVISGDKAAAAKELCEYVKKYVNSVEFATEYVKLREGAIPLTDRGMSLSDLKRNSEVHRLNIKNYPNDTKYVAEQQKLLDESEKKIAVMLDAAKKPFPGREAWEKLYPVDPAVIIKARLQEYLQVAATVDFTAKLTEPDKYKIKKFVNPVYEKKSLKWKAIYRAGKEVNDAVTAFVKEWLKGEIIAKEKTTMAVTTPAATTPPPTTATKPASQSESIANSSPGTTNPEPAPAEKKPSGSKLKDKLKSIIRN